MELELKFDAIFQKENQTSKINFQIIHVKEQETYYFNLNRIYYIHKKKIP